ncbi:hypothetical protein DEM26_03715 [Thioclava sp. NG1]|uniref:F0F1 ATP synthase subunit B family protein n=1 Tax=unclassified Thioclava TaxID=2621713 RepID=UPI000B53F579|nr:MULTISPECIES: ATP synthase F0 subunit B [unclassified Thioclava]OWY13736.1 hypothetical protein B6V72_06930 [Thioclava sp. F34-6]PWE51014.1 hypothetical protein DEM26_03715 [Thioclava sp. NG1]
MTLDWWTLGLQTLNAAVLIWLLSRVLWRPIVSAIQARQAEADKQLSDASEAARKADEAKARAEAALDQVGTRKSEILAQAQTEAEAARKALLDHARAEAADMARTAEAERAARAEEAEKRYAARAADLAQRMAERIGARLSRPALLEAYATDLLAQVAALDTEDRAALGSEKLMLRISEAVEAGYGEAFARRVGQTLGKEIGPAIKTDAALICGLALETEHLHLESSWAADLARMRKEVANDTQ